MIWNHKLPNCQVCAQVYHVMHEYYGDLHTIKQAQVGGNVNVKTEKPEHVSEKI